MTNYNFKSIFAWNIYLYTGFMVIVVVYLWTMMERKMNRFTKAAGTFAFVWRLALTTGTGSIFGFIVARQGYDAAIYAPMFIVMSFAFGLAIYLLVLMFAFDWDKRELGDKLFLRLKNLLGVFVAGSLYFVIAYHLTNLYGTENHEYESFILLNGGVYTMMFWIGQIFIGALLPLGIIYHPALGQSRGAVAAACFMVILGGLATMYVIIIGGQAFPMAMFPGKEIIGSTFYDAGLAPYAPSLPEVALGIGGVAAALLMTAIGIRMLRFLPETLSDKALDPHS
jgi:molybdopterin-containing oxidoreductase family membrane subunit